MLSKTRQIYQRIIEQVLLSNVGGEGGPMLAFCYLEAELATIKHIGCLSPISVKGGLIK
jgi:hypothetical protein